MAGKKRTTRKTTKRVGPRVPDAVARARIKELRRDLKKR